MVKSSEIQCMRKESMHAFISGNVAPEALTDGRRKRSEPVQVQAGAGACNDLYSYVESTPYV